MITVESGVAAVARGIEAHSLVPLVVEEVDDEPVVVA